VPFAAERQSLLVERTTSDAGFKTGQAEGAGIFAANCPLRGTPYKRRQLKIMDILEVNNWLTARRM
jgi:hypothetical protein